MFFNLKVTYLNDYVKITSVKLKGVSDKFNARKVSNDIQKNHCNLVRSKNKIMDLALCNSFCYFFTLTFNTKFDRFNLDLLRNEWKKVLRDVRDKYKIELKYLIVPEQHKNGAWHFHGFLTKEIENCFKVNEYNHLCVEVFERLGLYSLTLKQFYISFVKNP